MFSLKVKSSPELKIIISVSKKVSKKAVIRNTVKRRVRAVIKNLKLEPASYIFIAKPGAENLKGKTLENELTRIIRLIRNF